MLLVGCGEILLLTVSANDAEYLLDTARDGCVVDAVAAKEEVLVAEPREVALSEEVDLRGELLGHVGELSCERGKCVRGFFAVDDLVRTDMLKQCALSVTEALDLLEDF